MLYSFKKIEEMRITIEDLEALKELNDELEENHMETEKQLHEDLGMSWRCLSSLSQFISVQTTRTCKSANMFKE